MPGAKLRYQFRDQHEMLLPAKDLKKFLRSLPGNMYAEFPVRPAPQVTSEGVGIIGAGDFHASSVDGTGVTIAIVDVGFNEYRASQGLGEITASVVYCDFTSTASGAPCNIAQGDENLNVQSDHGTNVAEIAHDVAPGASLYLVRVGTLPQINAAVDYLTGENINIINHSLAWFVLSYYDGTGPLCTDVVDNATNSGILWVGAAGNYRNQHWDGIFNDTNNDLTHEFNSSTFYLTANKQTAVFLNWDDYPANNRGNVDYDLYAYVAEPASPDAPADYSSTRNQVKHPPNQAVAPYETLNLPTGKPYYLVVKKRNSSQPDLPLTVITKDTIISPRVAARSLAESADCVNALTVGATNAGTDAPDGASSEGPNKAGDPKPDLAAPTAVQTSIYSKFQGTSAAAPHVAGAAALLMQANPGATPDEIRTLLINSTHDL